MWELDYNEEVKYYFLDNDPYTFPLLIKLEELKFEPDAIPQEGCTPLDEEPGLFMWVVLDHLVVYEKLAVEHRLRILVVKPLDVE
jgi:hypothetical protein